MKPRAAPADASHADEPLRRRALDRLGPLADVAARDALEHGAITIAAEEASWEGSLGTVVGHRAVLRIPSSVLVRIGEASRDALVAAIAAALAERPGHALADLVLEEGTTTSRTGSPYRG